MIPITGLLKSSLALSAANSAISLISRRGVRGVPKIFRTELPKYKVKMNKLPVLTDLLTQPEAPTSFEEEKNLRQDKLLVYKNYLPASSNTILLEALFHPDNHVDRLLEIIDDNLETMSSFYIGVAFEALDDMMRANPGIILTVSVSPEFKRLCTKALYKMRFLEADEVLKLIKCFSTLKIPENTLLVQAALQMARHLINDFNRDELESLHMSLEEFEPIGDESKSLLISLKNVIPLVQKRQLEERQLTRVDMLPTSDKIRGLSV